MLADQLLRLLRPTARRFRETGKVVSVDQSGIRYPVVVRFEKVRPDASTNVGAALVG